MKISKLLIVGTINNFCLETSYATAAQQLSIEVVRFDPAREVLKYVKFGKFGRTLQNFLPVDVWTRKMNRELIVLVKKEQPDVMLIGGGQRIDFGALATIKIIAPQCKVCWFWPDSPMSLTASLKNCGPLFDLSASYSKATLKQFGLLGFHNPQWVPFAGDWSLHGKQAPTSENFERDISFVGMWRPEREKFLKIINDNFQHVNIKIYGHYWKRNCQDKSLLKRWSGDGFYAGELSQHFHTTRLNINVIDDTNYPGANMRFFEIPTSGGLQLTSACPEFEDVFVDGVNGLYFRNEQELIEKVQWVLSNPAAAQSIRVAANKTIQQAHTYRHRLESIIQLLEKSE